MKITGSKKGFSFNTWNRMNNWIHLKDSRLYCLKKDIIVCQFNFEEDQLVQTDLIVKRQGEER